MPTEADSCRELAVRQLQPAGWDNGPHCMTEQVDKLGAGPFDLLCHFAVNALDRTPHAFHGAQTCINSR